MRNPRFKASVKARAAQGEFFERHSDAVLAFVRRRINSGDEAADVTAEVFAAALVAVHEDRARRVPSAAAWLCGIARHKLIDSYRAASVARAARARIGLPRLAVDDAELERIDSLAGTSVHVGTALEELSNEERNAVIDRIVHERDYEDMAVTSAQDPATIRKRVSRGLARLRHQVED